MSKSNRMTRPLACLIWCALLTSFGEAGTRWASVIGGSGVDEFISLQRTTDGGTVLVGYTHSFGAGISDGWCVKLDASGNVLWQKTYGGSGFSDLWAALATTDGGCLLVGETTSSGAGGYDGWCLKLDASGNIVWQKTYGGPGSDGLLAGQTTADGGYILAGYTASFGAGNNDAWCLKLDASGNVVWQKVYGGSGYDNVNAVQKTADGGYIFAGVTGSFGAGGNDAWCVKLDAFGNILWQKTYGGSGSDSVAGIQAVAGGGYIIAGRTDSFGAGGTDAWCLQLDASGNVVWQKTYGGSGSEDARVVQTTADGGYILAGRTNSSGAGDVDAWGLKLDAFGNVQWQKTYGGSTYDIATAMQVSADGGYILGGTTKSFGAGNEDGWCLKTDAAGNIDISCASLFLSSNASVGDSSSAASASPSPVTPTTVTGTSSGAAAVDSAAVTSLLCSGGTSGPTISSITSKTSKPGSKATINGSGFSSTKTQDIVYFGTKKAVVKKATATKLTVTIPRKVKGTVSVYVTANGQTSDPFSFTVK